MGACRACDPRPAKAGGNKRHVEVREVMNGIMQGLRVRKVTDGREEWMASDLAGLDILVVHIDGIHIVEDLVVDSSQPLNQSVQYDAPPWIAFSQPSPTRAPACATRRATQARNVVRLTVRGGDQCCKSCEALQSCHGAKSAPGSHL